MKIYWLHFFLGIFIAVVAYFEFPFPVSFDRWLFIVIGVIIAITSFNLLNKIKIRDIHEEKNSK